MNISITIFSTDDPNVNVLCTFGIKETTLSCSVALSGIHLVFQNEIFTLLEKDSDDSWDKLFMKVIDILSIEMSIDKEMISIERSTIDINHPDANFHKIFKQMKQMMRIILKYQEMNFEKKKEFRDTFMMLEGTIRNAVLNQSS